MKPTLKDKLITGLVIVGLHIAIPALMFGLWYGYQLLLGPGGFQ